MKITSIELAGIIEKGKRLPRAFARISRPNGCDTIRIETILPGGEHTHHIPCDCETDIRQAASCLHRILEGRDGTRGEEAQYVRVLRHFAD